jgi:glutathione S-transferase
VADEGGFALERWPAVSAWLARVAALPGYIGIDD